MVHRRHIDAVIPTRIDQQRDETFEAELPPAEKARFYRIGRRSATESVAILDVCRS